MPSITKLHIRKNLPVKNTNAELSLQKKGANRLYSLLLSILCLIACFNGELSAQTIEPAGIFGDNMVLQQGINAPIWGKASPHQVIRLFFAGKQLTTQTDQQGNWRFNLPKHAAGGPFRIVIADHTDSVVFSHVMVGEVWLASGQSNMQFTLHEAKNSVQEIQEANYPDIRFFTVEHAISQKPLTKVQGEWKICNPENAGNFSAVAYFFARELNRDKKVPVGIISSSWGATPAEAWTSGDALLKHPDFKDSVTHYRQKQEDWELLYRNYLAASEAAKKTNGKPPIMPAQKNYPTALFNAMIAPLIPYSMRGVIWYQGENNANNSRGIQYRSLFPLLIRDWRNQWKNDTLPFVFVQLANFKERNAEPVFTDNWALLREAQLLTLRLPHTGMAVTIDIGDAKTIHPTNKQDVGKRLYLAANHVAYHAAGEYSGPLYKNMMIQGNRITVSFRHTGSGLMSKGDALDGFAVAGSDRKFYWADATISGNKVILSCAQVSHPVAVRYAWAINPPAGLYNKEGLPATPFRTDDW
ncbi:MAG: sialate O-acetylesterase [Bacteroidota bacterium]|nr:sialate O-acetylesterase [Bacteroidota bacterium]